VSHVIHENGVIDMSLQTAMFALDFKQFSTDNIPDDLNEDEVYASLYNHTAIIAREIFDNVQQMRMDRSNIVLNEDGTKSRKSTHYFSKAEGRNR
jgi:hypothetical protein